jgi:hypothetical protein
VIASMIAGWNLRVVERLLDPARRVSLRCFATGSFASSRATAPGPVRAPSAAPWTFSSGRFRSRGRGGADRRRRVFGGDGGAYRIDREERGAEGRDEEHGARHRPRL